MKKEVSFSSDIYKKVADKLDCTPEFVEENYKAILKILNGMAKDPEVGSIGLPGLGRMYFKMFHARNVANTIENRYPDTPIIKVLRDKADMIEKEVEGEIYSKHKKRNRISNFFYTKKKSFQELEEFQNKVYNEQKKD